LALLLQVVRSRSDADPFCCTYLYIAVVLDKKPALQEVIRGKYAEHVGTRSPGIEGMLVMNGSDWP
jgi:hypothetical protein